MYFSGIMQSLMWKEFTPEGQLKWQFMDTVTKMIPFYATRAVGGTLYLIGAVAMVYNLVKTAKAGSFLENEDAEAPALEREPLSQGREYWHRWIERKPVQMMIVSLVVVAIGGIVEFVPTFLVKSNIPTIASVKPYTPLELHGRDIYVREGCYTCHSQMIRPFRSETARYGEYSKAGEFVYDHPFQWGSKRTGPDLARVGGKYPDSWHFNHMLDPASMSPGSIMPPYPWLFDDQIDVSSTVAKINAMKRLGVPYPDGYEKTAAKDMETQANLITDRLKKDGVQIVSDREIVALIAYLQRLGTDIKNQPKETASK
jgi:cytochrome c oxidase cbb3-type subunit I/II